MLDPGGCRKARVWGLSLVHWGHRRRRVRVNSLGTWRPSLGITARVCVIHPRRGLLEDVSWRVTWCSWSMRDIMLAEKRVMVGGGVGSRALESESLDSVPPHTCFPGCVTLGELSNLSGPDFFLCVAQLL